jgi:hypothetical protein
MIQLIYVVKLMFLLDISLVATVGGRGEDLLLD